MVTSTKLETTESMRSPVALPSDVLTSMNRQAGSSFIVRFFGMVQMRVTPGPQNQAQRTQSVSPIGLVVNGLHCAASHTHTTSLRCHPHVPTFEPCQFVYSHYKDVRPAGSRSVAKNELLHARPIPACPNRS